MDKLEPAIKVGGARHPQGIHRTPKQENEAEKEAEKEVEKATDNNLAEQNDLSVTKLSKKEEQIILTTKQHEQEKIISKSKISEKNPETSKAIPSTYFPPPSVKPSTNPANKPHIIQPQGKIRSGK